MKNIQLLCPPAQKELPIQPEGTPEEALVTGYRTEGPYTLWYDAESFVPAALENSVLFELKDTPLTGEVSFSN